MDILPHILNRFVSRSVVGEKRPVFINAINGVEHDTLAACHAAIAQQLTTVGGVYNDAARRDYTLQEIKNLLQ